MRTPRSANSRQAIVHRPGIELSRLTLDNYDELLFDDVHLGEVVVFLAGFAAGQPR